MAELQDRRRPAHGAGDRDRRLRRAAGAAGLGAAALAILAVVIQAAPPREADEVRLTDTASAPAYPPETTSQAAAGWRELPPPPLSPREGAAAF